jgi:lipopolysaccharide exporter
MTSRIVTQSISFVTSPIITRLFLPEYFGIRQIFMSLSSIIISVSCLRYELSITLGKDKREAISSFIISFVLTLFFTLLTTTLVLLLKGKIVQWFKSPELNTFLWLLPAAVFIGGLGSALRYYASREGKFSVIAWSDFVSSLGGILITIGWALVIGSSATGLFVGYFTGIGIGILFFIAFFGRELLFEIKIADLNFNTVWTVAKNHRKFPFFETWSGLLSAISPQLPTIIFGLYYSTSIIGYYSLGNRIITLPMSLLSGTISEVFFPSAAKEYNETGTLFNSVSIIFKRIIQIAVFPIVALGFLGSPIFCFMFGEKWIEAGVYAQILSISGLMSIIAVPFTTVFIILKRQELALFFNLVATFVTATALLLGAKFGGPRIGLAIFVTSDVIIIIFVLFWILRKSGVSLKWGAMTFLKYLVISSLLLLPAGYFSWSGKSILFIFLGLGFATLIYLCGLYLFEPSFRKFRFKI